MNFEMLSTDALSFLNAIQACNLVGFDDLKRQLTEKIDISKNIKNAKAQKVRFWFSILFKNVHQTIEIV